MQALISIPYRIIVSFNKRVALMHEEGSVLLLNKVVVSALLLFLISWSLKYVSRYKKLPQLLLIF